MTSKNYDLIIVGSGPAAYGFLRNKSILNKNILLIDNSSSPISCNNSTSKFIDNRLKDNNQFEWSIGSLYPFTLDGSSSPKMSLQQHHLMMNNENDNYKNFFLVNNSALGGMSNLWGAGISILNDDELKYFPFNSNDFKNDCNEILSKIPFISGLNDDLSAVLNIDSNKNFLPLDEIFNDLLINYDKSRNIDSGFSMGRSRLAVNYQCSDSYSNSCTRCGQCFWGCRNESIFNAKKYIKSLVDKNFISYLPNTHINLFNDGGNKFTYVIDKFNNKYYAKKIVLAAGTIETTKITLRSSKNPKILTFQSSPSLAFLLLKKNLKYKKNEDNFALAQLSYFLSINKNLNLFGSLSS